jgi:rubrerythrin
MSFERLTRFVARLAASVFLVVATAALALAHATESYPAPATSHPAGVDRPQSLGPSATEGVWTCPMHAGIHEHGPGKCPICKMKLVKAKSSRT